MRGDRYSVSVTPSTLPVGPLPTSSVPQLNTIADVRGLASLLGVEYGRTFVYYLYRQLPLRKYKTFHIKKKSGDVRVIDAPDAGLRFLQERLLPLLEEIYKPKKSIHGFVKQRSIITGANPHKRHRYVFNIDIENLFGSINFGRVRGMLMAAPYKMPVDVATVIAQICCHDNRLPQGACTSPILANMICSKLDSALTAIARDSHCFYTRYADDITFSTAKSSLSKDIAYYGSTGTDVALCLGVKLEAAIKANGFLVNYAKVRLKRSSERQVVTGLIVNRKVNVDRRLVRSIRGALHAWRKHGYDDAQKVFLESFSPLNHGPGRPGPSLEKTIRGRIEFVGSVKGWGDPVYLRLRMAFNALTAYPIKKSGASNSSQIELATWIIEDEEDIVQGSIFYLDGYGFVTNAHCVGEKPVIYHPSIPSERHSVVVRSLSTEYDLAILDPPSGFVFPKPLRANFAEDAVITSDPIRVVGYPNFAPGKTISFVPGAISSKEMVSGRPRYQVSAIIQSGNSGGPVLDARDQVIGVAVTGVPSIDHPELEKYDMMVIPIRSIRHLSV